MLCFYVKTLAISFILLTYINKTAHLYHRVSPSFRKVLEFTKMDARKKVNELKKFSLPRGAYLNKWKYIDIIYLIEGRLYSFKSLTLSSVFLIRNTWLNVGKFILSWKLKLNPSINWPLTVIFIYLHQPMD